MGRELWLGAVLLIVGCGDAGGEQGTTSAPIADYDGGQKLADHCKIVVNGKDDVHPCDVWIGVWPADHEPANKCQCPYESLVVGGGFIKCKVGSACQVWPAGTSGEAVP